MMSDFFALAMCQKLHNQYLYIHNEVILRGVKFTEQCMSLMQHNSG